MKPLWLLGGAALFMVVWGGIAISLDLGSGALWLPPLGAFCIAWAWISISQEMEGDKHQSKARELASEGNWEQASVSYKLAIISRLDSDEKLRELVPELGDLYKAHGVDADLSRLYECPEIVKSLGADTGNQKKKNELLFKLYTETAAFLDSLPGPKIPEE